MNVFRTVAVLVAFALLMLAGGLYAFFSAPPEANRATALMVPGIAAALILICAAITRVGRSRPGLATGGWACGLALALLLGAMIAMPTSRRSAAAANYPAALEAFRAAHPDGGAALSRDERKAFFRERNSPDHDTTYLTRTLWSLTGLCGVAFVALVIARPRPATPPAGATSV